MAGSARGGFITWALASKPDLLTVALERKPAAVMLSFGDLAGFAPAIHRAGIPASARPWRWFRLWLMRRVRHRLWPPAVSRMGAALPQP